MKKNTKVAAPVASKTNTRKQESVNLKLNTTLAILCAVFAFMLYANTLNHEYALDDFPTIYGNRLTMSGVESIPTLLKTAYWYGLDGQNDWLYRPLSMVMFATEWQIAPNTPALGHWVNVLLYALTGFLLFRFLVDLFKNYNVILPFAITMLWLAHPIHTEVVANIKSRDEILAMLFCVLTLHQTLKYVFDSKQLHLILAGAFYFLALLAKESPITLLAIIPLTLWVFGKSDFKKIIVAMIPVVISAVVYLTIRSMVLTSQTGDDNIPVIDNSLMAAPDVIHRQATAFYILGYYIRLLFYPHPMSSDYSFRQFEIVGFDNVFAILSVVAYFGMGIYGVIRLMKKDPVGYGIMFYLIIIGLVANVLFLTRSTAADRFLYMPSLGFYIALVFILLRAMKIDFTSNTYFASLEKLTSYNKNFTYLIAFLLIISSIKTIARNPDWKNDTSIFSTDITHAPNSARLQFLHANHLLQDMKQGKTAPDKLEPNYQEALKHFQIAVNLNPDYMEAYMGMGEALTYKNNFTEAVKWYEKAIAKNPKFSSAYNNLGNMYFKMQDYPKGISYLKKAIEIQPNYSDAWNNLGSCYFSNGDYNNAIMSFKKAIELFPQFTDAYKNLGSCYGMMKDYNTSISYFLQALKLSPDNADINQFLGMTYQFKGDQQNANFYLQKAEQLKKEVKK